jgi:hypothetical protein
VRGVRQAIDRIQEGFCAVALCPDNRSPRILVYNFLVNSALYLFYQLTPFYESLQAFNSRVLWRIAYYF